MNQMYIKIMPYCKHTKLIHLNVIMNLKLPVPRDSKLARDQTNKMEDKKLSSK